MLAVLDCASLRRVWDVMTCRARRVHRDGRVIGAAVHGRLTINFEIGQVVCPLNVLPQTQRRKDMFAGPVVLFIYSQKRDRPVSITDQKPSMRSMPSVAAIAKPLKSIA
jgi:hypothetical protein